MISLRQEDLDLWQKENFGEMTIQDMALGMAEEVGEICHHILKGKQKIRGGKDGIDYSEVADGVCDTIIYGINLLSLLGLNAEMILKDVIEKVLERDWKVNPEGFNKPIQGS